MRRRERVGVWRGMGAMFRKSIEKLGAGGGRKEEEEREANSK